MAPPDRRLRTGVVLFLVVSGSLCLMAAAPSRPVMWAEAGGCLWVLAAVYAWLTTPAGWRD